MVSRDREGKRGLKAGRFTFAFVFIALATATTGLTLPPADLGYKEADPARAASPLALGCEGGAEPEARAIEQSSVEASDDDLAALRCISDPYPTFNGIAVDPENNVVAVSDTNRKSFLFYDRVATGKRREQTEPLRSIMGPKTRLGYIAGVLLDPKAHEAYTVNNDIEDTVVVFSYGAEGNLTPQRLLAVPHQAWGLALSRATDEIAVTVESLRGVIFYRRDAKGVEAPTRSIIGRDTGLADPHGIYIDDASKEIVVANHGNWGEQADYSTNIPESTEGGRFDPPSITIFGAAASGNAKPLRTISGPKSRLNWPMGVAVDASSHEIAVANNGDNSILIFRQSDSGDVSPVRVIRGPQTGIDRPMSVAIDAKNKELWVANFGNHSATVFELKSSGNVPPRRIIWSAPPDAPTAGFGNPSAVAYDTKRQEILIPN
jgi:DNA-binding beta-propeller fold protein YncE